jgi:hypothetical protein
MRGEIAKLCLRSSLRGAFATKQSILPYDIAMPRDRLLRGACHRAALCADPLARNDGGGVESDCRAPSNPA